MKFRRIVTGHDRSGKSVFRDDLVETHVAQFQHHPGFEMVTVWSTEPNHTVPHSGRDPVRRDASVVPVPGGSQLLVVTFPPDSAITSETDFAALGAEYVEKLPGLAEKFEVDNPGMHTTDTVDYGIVLSGTIVLELDDGNRQLSPGDIVIQNGTRHAWRNPGDSPATIAFVLVGAHRTNSSP